MHFHHQTEEQFLNDEIYDFDVIAGVNRYEDMIIYYIEDIETGAKIDADSLKPEILNMIIDQAWKEHYQELKAAY